MNASVRHSFFLAILGLVLRYPGQAQSVSTLVGAENMAVGYASATLANAWVIHNNMGALAEDSTLHVGASYELNPSIPGGNRLAAAVVVPFGKKIGGAGLGVFRLGDNSYNEQVVSLGYGHRLGIASLGLRISYIQYHAEGLANKATVGISVGGLVHITPRFLIGAYVTNINRPTIGFNKERLPTLFVLGLQFQASKKVKLLAEVEKDLEYKPTIRGGVDYRVVEKLRLGTGFNLEPNAVFIGIGYRTWKLSVDYAAQYDLRSSLRHQASVGFYIASFSPIKKR